MPRRRRVHRYARRLIFMVLAALFMLEAWLWEKSGALVAYALHRIPWQALRDVLVRRIAHLSPWRTLGLFVIPVLILLPMKFFALWLLAQGSIFGGVSVILVAKLVGVGVSSFLFTLCKPKLLQLRAIAWLYHALLRAHGWAHRRVRPYTALCKRYVRRLRRATRHAMLWRKIRRRTRHKRARQRSKFMQGE